MSDSTSVEHWRPVVGHELDYLVSDQGRVWSNRSRRLLAFKVGRLGHLRVGLTRKGHQRWRYVHVLVLEAFVGPRPDGMVCCHGKGGPQDNRPANLRWGTYADNARDRIEDGNHFHVEKTHCPAGHPYDEANTYWYRGGRRCRTCKRAHQASDKGRASKHVRDARRRAHLREL